MIVAVIALAAVAVALAGVHAVVLRTHDRERERWSQERRALVDRAIAQHAGEIIALDRQASPRPKPDRRPDGPILVEGLN
jgi:hypothetical protein